MWGYRRGGGGEGGVVVPLNNTAREKRDPSDMCTARRNVKTSALPEMDISHLYSAIDMIHVHIYIYTHTHERGPEGRTPGVGESVWTDAQGQAQDRHATLVYTFE